MPVPAVFTHQITCSLLPIHMRELYEQWKSSGSVRSFDFGSGPVTSSTFFGDVSLVSSSLVARLDALSLDYLTSFAYGPIETGSVVSGSIFKAWRVQNFYNAGTQTGSIYLTRENDTGDNWRTNLPLFDYSGSVIKEIDVTFDQSARPVVVGDRDVYIGANTQSIIWVYRFNAGTNNFVFSPFVTGTNPRTLLDDPVDSSNSDVMVFYIRRLAPEEHPNFVYATGSGISGSVSSSYGTNAEVTLSLNPYWVSQPAELGVFSSKQGVGASIAITGGFNVGVQKVGAICVDADVTGNFIIAYDSLGVEIQRKQFAFDNAARVLTKGLQILTASGDFGTGSNLIKTFVLTAGNTDYVSYDAIVFEPTGNITTSRNWSFNEAFWVQQRDVYGIERQVPVAESIFFVLFDAITGSLSGTFGLTQPDGMTGLLYPTGTVSGAFQGRWSGSITASDSQSYKVYYTGSGVSGSSSQSFMHNSMSVRIAPYNTGSTLIFAQTSDFKFSDITYAPLATQYVSMSVTFSSPGVSYFEVTQRGQSISHSIQAYDVNGNLIDHVSYGTISLNPDTEFFPHPYVSASGRYGGPSPIFYVGFDDLPISGWGPLNETPAGEFHLFESFLFTPFLNVTASQGISGTFEGLLTGSLSGSIWGFASGVMSGVFSGTHGDFFGAISGTVNQFIVSESPFIYEMFLEDVVKQTDGRVALYLTRRIIDSGSPHLGEYRINKFETTLYPIQSQEDQYSASTDFFTGSLSPILIPGTNGLDAIISLSAVLPSGTHTLQSTLITHSVFDKEAVISLSAFLPSGSHALQTIVITHSVFDKEAVISMSSVLPSGSHAIQSITIVHTAYDKEAFVSMSLTMVSGSLA